jgi:hypothetical protein
MSWEMHVYMGRRLIAVETNERFAVPYWTGRKRVNKQIRWEIMR